MKSKIANSDDERKIVQDAITQHHMRAEGGYNTERGNEESSRIKQLALTCSSVYPHPNYIVENLSTNVNYGGMT